MYKYGERLQIFRIERERHREEYDLSMSYKFSKYILAFSCTWISKLRGPKGFSLHRIGSLLVPGQCRRLTATGSITNP